MNKQILIAMDWKNRSKEELKENYEAAANAAAVAYAAANSNNPAAIEYWLKEYLEKTGENREDYEKALGDMRK
tara:strand:+ start:905 stop:1123 length:219 start_codon:yes stop_codon:yes gene_type:complete